MEDPGTSRNAYRRPHVTIGADRVVSDVQQLGSSREHSLCAERDGHSTEKDEEQAVSSAMKLRYSLHQQDTNQRGADTARELDVPANGQQTNRRLRVPTASRRHDRKRSCVGMPEWDHAIKDAPERFVSKGSHTERFAEARAKEEAELAEMERLGAAPARGPRPLLRHASRLPAAMALPAPGPPPESTAQHL